MSKGKKYQDAIKKIDVEKAYSFDDAIKLVKEVAFAKFDETVELHCRLNLKKSQSVRDTFTLPNQFTAAKKILVFAKGDKAEEARACGAAFVGDAELVAKIKDGWLDFDVAIATPDMMKDVGKLGPILGRRGLMPNPKTGTVTNDIKNAIDELNKGRVEFRSDKTGVVHFAVGKVSMDAGKIVENILAAAAELKRKRPSDVKGDFIKTVAVASTMGPGVKISFRENA